MLYRSDPHCLDLGIGQPIVIGYGEGDGVRPRCGEPVPDACFSSDLPVAECPAVAYDRPVGVMRSRTVEMDPLVDLRRWGREGERSDRRLIDRSERGEHCADRARAPADDEEIAAPIAVTTLAQTDLVEPLPEVYGPRCDSDERSVYCDPCAARRRSDGQRPVRWWGSDDDLVAGPIHGPQRLGDDPQDLHLKVDFKCRRVHAQKRERTGPMHADLERLLTGDYLEMRRPHRLAYDQLVSR